MYKLQYINNFTHLLGRNEANILLMDRCFNSHITIDKLLRHTFPSNRTAVSTTAKGSDDMRKNKKYRKG